MMTRMKRHCRLRLNSVASNLERLEARELLDASGFLWGDAPQLTLSFAEEGTQVAGLRSALQQSFDGLGTADVWQGTVLRAFQVWASQTNGDIGVVNDEGLPFGVPGLARDDTRFGDIRVAAVPLAPDVLAVSIPSNTLVAGSWSGDVLFNSNVAWTSLEDLFSVALHEAGHVFGLEHNDDPNSPMHVHGVSNALTPTTADIAALQALHGVRMHDLNEYDGGGNDGASPGVYVGNEHLETATRLQAAHDGQGPDGSAPAIAQADISTATDVDYYWFDGLSDYDGPVTITVRPSGMSLLAPVVQLLNEQGDVLQSDASDSTSGESVSMTIAENDRHARYYIRVAGVDGALGIGHYSVTVAFDDVVSADPARIERFAGRDFRFATAHQIRDLFELGVDSYFNDDAHADDDPLESGELETALGYVEDTRYEAIGSISDGVDVDHYLFKSPRVDSGNDVPLTIAIDALEIDGLIPQLELLTTEEEPVSTTIVSNGLGRLVVQVPAATLDSEYLLRVKATSNAGLHATGNYKLSMVFGGQPVEFVDFATGIVNADVPVRLHALHVGQSQLVHLLLDLTDAGSASNGVWATVFDNAGAVRGRVGAQSGDARSPGALLLEPGAYVVQVGGVSLSGAPLTETPYRLRGAVISDPLGPILHDPTFDPAYNCPGQADVYCYPGGVQSTSPYLWSDFIESTPGGTPPADPNDLYNSWWIWFWSLQPGDTNGDQAVDIADLNNVRNHFGDSGHAPLGDADGDGSVGIEDLNRVRNNFGAGNSAPAPITAFRSAETPVTKRATARLAAEKAIDMVLGVYVSDQDTRVVRRRTRLR
jgi:hypothetical protein